ncbi:kinase-like domain-containing protein [Aspergillus egyptiacus]|nr:kinase-like domain-containing protein [Aspergillus egyptiacus]
MVSLSEDDCKVIESHPLGNSLDNLQQSLRDVERFDGADDRPDEECQKAVSLFLSALIETEAALALRSRISSYDVATELALLSVRVRKGDVSYTHYRPPVKLVIQKASDSDIWSAVLDLIATLSRAITKPASLHPAPNNSTPISSTFASEQDTEQIKQLVDARVFEEIQGCTYSDVQGFYEKYFEGKDWTDRAQDVYESIKDQRVAGAWTGLLQTTQDNVQNWLFQLQDRLLSDERRRYYKINRPGELTGGDVDADSFELILAKEFPPELDSLKPLCRVLRRILFSLGGRAIFTGTPKDPETRPNHGHMELLETLKKEAICQVDHIQISHLLSNTPFACSSITELNGGLVNATYRGTLSHALPDGSASVIIKHGEETVAKVPTIALSTSRCLTERTLLTALRDSPVQYIRHRGISIQCPQLYHSIAERNIQIVQDIPHDCTLHEWLLSPPASQQDDWSPSTMTEMGETLAIWLARFHGWSQSGIADRMSQVIRANSDRFDKDLSTSKQSLIARQCNSEQVRRHAAEILFPKPRYTDIMIHGDFSTRNILFRPQTSKSLRSIQPPRCALAIVDWETCCYGDFTRDVANMISDLYMHMHFSGGDRASSLLESFIMSYPPLSETSVYRTLAQVGENFFYWHVYAPASPAPERVDELLELGASFIVMGMKGDYKAVRETFLGGLLLSRASLQNGILIF